MAEIVKRKTRDGFSYQVKIFLGRFGGKRKFLIKTIRGKSEAQKWAREMETLRDTGKLFEPVPELIFNIKPFNE